MIWKYYLLSFLCFLGIVVGIIIGYLSKEELKSGRNILNWLRHLLFVAILILFFIKNPSVLFILLVATIIIAFSFSRYRETLYYYSLPVILFLSWQYNGFSILAPLVFLYGLPLGSLYLYEHIKKNKSYIFKHAILKYFGFLINALLLGLIGLIL